MNNAGDAVKSYEALFRIERELRYPLTRDEVEQRGRDAMGHACTVLHALRDVAELEAGWAIAAADNGNALARMLHDDSSMIEFLSAELKVLRASGLAADIAISTIGTCLEALSASGGPRMASRAPKDWSTTFGLVMNETCHLAGPPRPDSGDDGSRGHRLRSFFRVAIAVAGGAVVTIANVSATAPLLNPGLVAASTLLGAATMTEIDKWLGKGGDAG